MADLRIGALAERTGTNAPTIRYYEEIELLPRADRRPGGQRSYGDDDVRRLLFIRRCRDFGFGIEQIRSLLGLMKDRQRSCFEARDMARAHLEAVRAKLVELRALEGSIAAFVRSCDAACAGGPGPDCVILADLANATSARSSSCSPPKRPARAEPRRPRRRIGSAR
jgi:DNA-binding transcriptional MerR regulator